MATSAYKQAENNVLKSWLFIFVFSLLIIFLGYIFAYLFNFKELLFLAIILAIFQGLSAYFYSDRIILSSLKARPLLKKDYPQVYNVVENLAITCGIPTPQVYILEDNSLNAFATGRGSKRAVICLTRGSVEKFNKAELEGVIAHELSHIKNNDILLFSVIAIMISVVAFLSRWFLRVNYFSKRDDREREISSIFIIIGIIFALLAPLFASLLKLAISRKREFLADASAVLITRYPQGLIDALRKINLETQPTKITNPAFSHLFISDPFRKSKSWFLNLWSTHPPIEQRIKALLEMESQGYNLTENK